MMILLLLCSINAHGECNKTSPKKVKTYLTEAATAFELEPALLYAVAKVESNLDSCALSIKGAGGVMQLMPLTAQALDVENVFDAQENIQAGAQLLAQLQAIYKIPQLYLAAYNAGETAVNRKGYVPNYKETRLYIRKVIKIYKTQANVIDDYQAVQKLTLNDPLRP